MQYVKTLIKVITFCILCVSGGAEMQPFVSSEAWLERPTFNRSYVKNHRPWATERFVFITAIESNDEYLPCMTAQVQAPPLSQFANL